MTRQPDTEPERDSEPAGFMLARGLFGCSLADEALVKRTKPAAMPAVRVPQPI